MPALTIPACGYSVGSSHEIDDGVQRITALGGTTRGWTDYDASKRVFTLVHDLATTSEANTIVSEYNSNRLTGGMTISPPWIPGSVGTPIVCDYIAPPKLEPGPIYVRITQRLREQ